MLLAQLVATLYIGNATSFCLSVPAGAAELVQDDQLLTA